VETITYWYWVALCVTVVASVVAFVASVVVYMRLRRANRLAAELLEILFLWHGLSKEKK
jgi:hypothetical protein